MNNIYANHGSRTVSDNKGVCNVQVIPLQAKQVGELP